jgi:hypothetical protein
MIQFVLKRKSKTPEFQRKYLKLVGELPRDTEIVTPQSRIRNECMILRPGPAIALFEEQALNAEK